MLRKQIGLSLVATLAGSAWGGALLPTNALADCTPTPASNLTTTCTDTTILFRPLGFGEDGPDNATIIVEPDALVRGGNFNAISLRDGATITIGDGATVLNYATTTNGLWGAGGDTIENLGQAGR